MKILNSILPLLVLCLSSLSFAEPVVTGIATAPTWPATCTDPARDGEYLLRVRYPTITRTGSRLTIGFRAYQLHCEKQQDKLVARAFEQGAQFDLLWEVMMPWASNPTHAVRIKAEPIKGLWADVEMDLDYDQVFAHFDGANQGDLWLEMSTAYGSHYSGKASFSGLRTLGCPSLKL